MYVCHECQPHSTQAAVQRGEIGVVRCYNQVLPGQVGSGNKCRPGRRVRKRKTSPGQNATGTGSGVVVCGRGGVV